MTRRVSRSGLTRKLPLGISSVRRAGSQNLVDLRRGTIFTRVAFIEVKPGCWAESTRILGGDVIPRFRRERDFLGPLAFIVPDGTEALPSTLRNQKESVGADCPTDLFSGTRPGNSDSPSLPWWIATPLQHSALRDLALGSTV